jgi:hypothetical protein
MGVDVDKAGRDQQARGVLLFLALALDLAGGDDPAVLHGDIANIGRGARAIDDRAAADHEIICV